MVRGAFFEQTDLNLHADTAAKDLMLQHRRMFQPAEGTVQRNASRLQTGAPGIKRGAPMEVGLTRRGLVLVAAAPVQQNGTISPTRHVMFATAPVHKPSASFQLENKSRAMKLYKKIQLADTDCLWKQAFPGCRMQALAQLPPAGTGQTPMQLREL